LFYRLFGKMTSKANAECLLVIMPPDTLLGVTSYHCYKYYIKTRVMIFNGASRTNKSDSLVYEGRCIDYNPITGIKSGYTNYSNGKPLGKAVSYYPDGKLNSVVKYEDNGQVKLIEYRDSTGTVLAADGNGKWKKGNEEGMIKDSLEDGDWKEYVWGKPNYTITYSKGVLIATTDPDYIMGEHVYEYVTDLPKFNGNYGNFLEKNLRYPAEAKENNIQGKVIVQFIIEKDGSISDITVLKAPDKSLSDEAVRVIKLVYFSNEFRIKWGELMFGTLIELCNKKSCTKKRLPKEKPFSIYPKA
jgi:TonB family protein